MDAHELDRRARTCDGWVPPELVSRLVDHGHLGEVEQGARDGDWFCARAWARVLVDRGKRAEALEVLAPYLATGWEQAVRTVAELFEAWGEADKAIEVCRSHMQAGDLAALGHLTRLLARHGRDDEAFDLLLPYLANSSLAGILVEVGAGSGRDEEVATLLTARIEAGHRTSWPDIGFRHFEPGNALELLAEVRERQGRVDQAVALLRTREITSLNGRDPLADLLARHDRIEELRAYAEDEPHGHAAECLAEYLERRGDISGAIDTYRSLALRRSPHAHVALARLLSRHGRADEAIELLRSLPGAAGGDDDWVLDALCTLYAGQGRAEDGLAHLDGRKARLGYEETEIFRIRTDLLVACGRREQAIEEARARPEKDARYEVRILAELLSGAGRVAEAVAVLEPALPAHRSALAAHLVAAGRVEEAVALCRQDPGYVLGPLFRDDDDPPF
jgi:hypothetical protein